MREFLNHPHEMVAEVSAATAGSSNEATLRHELEGILERHCHVLGIPWTPFQLDRSLNLADGKSVRYADVAHGGVIIEYESPNSFGGREGTKLSQAQEQAKGYTLLIQQEEGRALSEYVLVAWDGSDISFGRFEDGEPRWGSLSPFNVEAAIRLLRCLEENGIPLVHPHLLSQRVGPESAIGSNLIPPFFQVIRNAAAHPEGHTGKTRLLFAEWRRLFGQVVGVQSDRLRELLERQGKAHRQAYSEDPTAYLFALNSYIALVAKLVAALSLPNGSQDLTEPATPVEKRIEALETGRLFVDAGV